MRFSNFTYIVAGNLAEKKLRTAFAVLVIAFAVIVALAVTAVTDGLLRGLQDRAADMFPPTVIMVKPKTVALAMLAFNTAVIDEAVVDKIKAMPGVKKVEPQLSIRVPLRMEVEIAGQYAVTDAVVIGVDPSAMADQIPNGASFKFDEATSQPIPCLVPKLLLDMYNLAYADSIGFPKINEDFLIGKRFTMVLGETYLAGGGGSGKNTKLLCQVKGLVSDPSLVPGVYMPIEYAKRINAWYSGKSDQPYTALRVNVAQADQVDKISKSLSDMGLNVEGKKVTYESIAFATKAGMIVLYSFAFLILLVAAFSILNLFSLIMAHRRGEMRLLTAVGATKQTLRWIYFSEAVVIAVVGAVLGAGIIYLVLTGLEKYIRNLLAARDLADLTVIPDRLFAFDFLSVAIVIIIVIAMAVISPLVITWRATSERTIGNSTS